MTAPRARGRYLPFEHVVAGLAICGQAIVIVTIVMGARIFWWEAVIWLSTMMVFTVAWWFAMRAVRALRARLPEEPRR